MPDWLSQLVTPIMSVLFGGATGIAGNLIAESFGVWKLKLQHEQERGMAEIRLKEREADLKEMEAEHKFRVEEGRLRNDGLQIEADARALEVSHLSDAASYLTGYTGKSRGVQWLLASVDFLRGIVRPALTAYLAWEVYALRADIRDILKAADLAAIDAISAMQLYGEVVQMTLFLSSVALTWWFGSRSRAPAGKAVPA